MEGLARVAEMAPNLLLAVRRREHPYPIAKFEHQVGRRHEVRIIATDMQ